MKKIKNKLAFTLIELLVVITIIGILATGAVSVFTTQLQGARDTTRINDMKVIETALHQIFSDEGEYPEWDTTNGSGAFKTKIKEFVSKDLEDPKHGKPVCFEDLNNKQNCQGYYSSFKDDYDLERAAFKLAFPFEKKTNYEQKAKNNGKDGDGGNEESMYEIYAGAGANSGAVDKTHIMY